MISTKRILTAAVGLPLLLALGACGKGYGSRHDDASTTTNNVVAATNAPEVTTEPSGAPAAGAGSGSALEAPVGIPTDKLIGTSIPKMGKVVTDANGWVLYRFDKDTAKPSSVSACSGQCAAVWPPVLTDGNPVIEGLSSDLVATVTRDDGSTQLTLAGWPLYRYVGDPKPGAWKGQLVNGTWFVISTDGKKNLTCVPTSTPTAVAPPASTTPADGAGTGASGTGY